MTDASSGGREDGTSDEDDLRHRVDDSRLTDAIAETRDRAAARADQELVESGALSEEELEARRLDRFLAGRERDDAIGFGNAVKEYVDRRDRPEE